MSKQSLNCGSCLHLNREKAFERPCIELGKIQTSKACSTHKPDAHLLVGDDRKIGRLEHLAAAVSGMTPLELQTTAALLLAERNTRKHGWKFYQKVYVRYIGVASSNFMSNFMVGRVLYADKDFVRIIGDSGKVFVSAMNDKNSSTLYSATRFKELRDSMVADKKLVDPKIAQMAAASARGAIARLDDAVAQVEKISPKLKRGRSRDDDLVSLVSKMQQGKIARVRVQPARKARTEEGGEIVTSW